MNAREFLTKKYCDKLYSQERFMITHMNIDDITVEMESYAEHKTDLLQKQYAQACDDYSYERHQNGLLKKQLLAIEETKQVSDKYLEDFRLDNEVLAKKNLDLKKQVEELDQKYENLKSRSMEEAYKSIDDMLKMQDLVKELKAENEKLKSNQLRGFERQWSKETTIEDDK